MIYYWKYVIFNELLSLRTCNSFPIFPLSFFFFFGRKMIFAGKHILNWKFPKINKSGTNSFTRNQGFVFVFFCFSQIPRVDAVLSLVSCFCCEAGFSEDARQGLGFGGSRERRGGHAVIRCRRRGRNGFRSRGGSRAPAARGGSQNPRRQSVGIPREGAWLLHLASCWPEPWKEASWFQQRPYYRRRRRSRWVKGLRVFFVSLFLLLL